MRNPQSSFAKNSSGPYEASRISKGVYLEWAALREMVALSEKKNNMILTRNYAQHLD